MKRPPDAELSYRPLHDIAMGPLKAALLNCGIDLKVFDLLTADTAPDEVAGRLGTHAENTRRLLDALTTIDLLEKRGGLYRNRPIAGQFLVSTAPTYLGPLLRQTQHAGLNPLEQLASLVKEGPGQDGGLAAFADERIWAAEVKSSAGWVLGGVGRQVADIVAALPGFGDFEKMLDLGCGHGVFSIYFLDRHPSLQSVLFDRAAVLQAARAFVDDFGMTGRIAYVPGDYLQDDIGDGFDLIFASATLNFAIDNLAPLIAKIHQALKPGGCFVSFQDGMTHEQTKPDTMLGAVMPAMMGGRDVCFEQGRIARAALDAGFRQVWSRTLETAIGAMDLDIARKG